MMNGTIKTFSIIVVTLIALGTITWSFARQNERLERVVEDVVVVEASSFKTAERLTVVEKAVILIQNDMGHMATDIAEIRAMQKEILDKLE